MLKVSANITGAIVIARVIIHLGLPREELNLVRSELHWLFTATDHFLMTQEGAIDRAAPIPLAIPPQAKTNSSDFTNTISADIDDFWLQIIEEQVESLITQINIYLANLTFKVDEEARIGMERVEISNIPLMNSIKFQQKAIIECIEELAGLIQRLYGVAISSPSELAEILN